MAFLRRQRGNKPKSVLVHWFDNTKRRGCLDSDRFVGREVFSLTGYVHQLMPAVMNDAVKINLLGRMNVQPRAADMGWKQMIPIYDENTGTKREIQYPLLWDTMLNHAIKENSVHLDDRSKAKTDVDFIRRHHSREWPTQCALCVGPLNESQDKNQKDPLIVVLRPCAHVFHESCFADLIARNPIPVNEDGDDEDGDRRRHFDDDEDDDDDDEEDLFGSEEEEDDDDEEEETGGRRRRRRRQQQQSSRARGRGRGSGRGRGRGGRFAMGDDDDKKKKKKPLFLAECPMCRSVPKKLIHLHKLGEDATQMDLVRPTYDLEAMTAAVVDDYTQSVSQRA